MIHYVEFDSSTQSILADLRIEILKCTDWSRIGLEAVLGTSTVATTANATFINVADTSGMGLVIGDVIAIGNGVERETRAVTNVISNQLNFAALRLPHPIGSEIHRVSNIFKATTTRGAQMVVNLSDSGFDLGGVGLNLATYVSHDGTTGLGKQLKYLLWRYNGGNSTVNPLHVTLSLSKEHLFLMIEGPRPGETNVVNAQYGSFRNYFFLSDLVPYDEEDAIPAVVCGGAGIVAVQSSVANNSHVAHISRNLEGTGYWAPVRLASLQFPIGGDTAVLNLQRQRELDDRYILSPYVAFLDETGMRGRLYALFFAGFNQSTEHAVSPPAVGSRVQYQGLWYKLIAVNKGDGNRAAWGVLGSASNELSGTYQRSAVVGVPCLP